MSNNTGANQGLGILDSKGKKFQEVGGSGLKPPSNVSQALEWIEDHFGRLITAVIFLFGTTGTFMYWKSGVDHQLNTLTEITKNNSETISDANDSLGALRSDAMLVEANVSQIKELQEKIEYKIDNITNMITELRINDAKYDPKSHSNATKSNE